MGGLGDVVVLLDFAMICPPTMPTRSLSVMVAAMAAAKGSVVASIGLAGSSLDVSELIANSAVVPAVSRVSVALGKFVDYNYDPGYGKVEHALLTAEGVSTPAVVVVTAASVT